MTSPYIISHLKATELSQLENKLRVSNLILLFKQSARIPSHDSKGKIKKQKISKLYKCIKVSFLLKTSNYRKI